MKAELVPLNGDTPIAIARDVTLIGRREYCDVVLPHPSLSKRHCVLVRTDGLLIVRDLVSTNGTKVNGQRVMWAALLPNDKLTLGRLKFKVYLGPDHELSPSELGRRSADGLSARNGEAARPNGQAAASAENGFAAPSPLHLPAINGSAAASLPDFDFEPLVPLPEVNDDDGLEILDDEESLPQFELDID